MNNLLFDRLRPIGFTAAFAHAFDSATVEGAWPARVTEVQRETLTLDDGATAGSARLHPQLERRLAEVADAIAVGDWVAATRDGHGDAWVRNFHKLAREVRRDQMTHLERRREVALWKSRSRAAEQRARMKRG